ncbi:methyltransferase domain-containing protein [Pseudomonas sp. JS3066]|uniref:methyltransferase domain-containing protein n=1 Tax=Pseudomonas sp. JS3066 TaxID=3090665 RepID=UPI002E7B13F0|nr:methyltransferase domain-containing protein [Pseudomonas sp. JS3066]WVK92833.1 methyltransferase domain-containing protein [Pseudomonas sp. JS3066]
MIDEIIDNFNSSSYDFREHANPNDPLAHLFDEWVDYYRMKWSIAKVIQPRRILEVGVRFGYSARAFLAASPKAALLGIDIDSADFGGQPGAVDWAQESIRKDGFDFSVLKTDTAKLTRLPGETYDLIHVDGQQDGDGTFHDLDLALPQSRFILVDGYHWTRSNFLAVNEWIWLNKAAIHSACMIPGYAGEMLIRTRLDSSIGSRMNSGSSGPLADTYTKDYYLNDCGGFSEWKRSQGREVDPRLQAVADAAYAVTNPTSVVDLGAGRGELTRLFALKGATVTSIDYSKDACELTRRTLADEEGIANRVEVICDSVLNESAYAESYDLAVASDIIEHLSPEENDQLYGLVSQKLKQTRGALVIHTAPNLWCYQYEHPRQQRHAIAAGFWLPRTRRTWYERLMHINEQNPRVLKEQLQRHFPHVLLWFTDHTMGGSLIRRFGIRDLRTASSIFAIASHQPIDKEAVADAFRMLALPEPDARNITLEAADAPPLVTSGQLFSINVTITNNTGARLASLPPCPLNLSYHWLDELGNVEHFEGLRTPLDQHLDAGSSGNYQLSVRAPSAPGKYVLQITTVQEQVRWHESDGEGLSQRINVIPTHS